MNIHDVIKSSLQAGISIKVHQPVWSSVQTLTDSLSYLQDHFIYSGSLCCWLHVWAWTTSSGFHTTGCEYVQDKPVCLNPASILLWGLAGPLGSTQEYPLGALISQSSLGCCHFPKALPEKEAGSSSTSLSPFITAPCLSFPHFIVSSQEMRKQARDYQVFTGSHPFTSFPGDVGEETKER